MIKEKISSIYSGINDYIDKRIDLMRMELISAASHSITKLASSFVLMLMIFAFSFFTGITAAIYLSQLFDSYILGFGSMALFFLVLLLIYIFLRKDYIEKQIYKWSIMLLTKEVDNKKQAKS